MKKIYLFCFALLTLNTQAQSTSDTKSRVDTLPNPDAFYEKIVQIKNPVKGDVVFDKSYDCMREFDGKKWKCIETLQSAAGNAMTVFKDTATAGYGQDIKVDSNYVYVCGAFIKKAVFGTYRFESPAYAEAFIVKYDKEGNVIWAKQSLGGGAWAYAIEVDKSGNVYVAGVFSSEISFDGKYFRPETRNDIFLVKYDKDGHLSDFCSFGGAGLDWVYDMIPDKKGNILLTGRFDGKLSFGTSTIISDKSSNSDLFVAKYGADFKPKWIIRAGGKEVDQGNSLAIDSKNNIYVTGAVSKSEVNIDFNGTIIKSAGVEDMLIAKLDSNGKTKWVKTIGGKLIERGKGIAIDSHDNIYICGEFNSPSISINKQTFYLKGSTDMLLLRLNTNGNILWATSYGSKGNNIPYQIKINKNDEIAFAGSIGASLDINSSIITTAAQDDIFIAKIDNTGRINYLQTAGSKGFDSAYALDIDNSGQIFFTGYFSDDCRFGKTMANGGLVPKVFVAKASD